MDRENQPRSLQSPWWLGKARRHHVLVKFIIICVVVALLFLGIIIFATNGFTGTLTESDVLFS